MGADINFNNLKLRDIINLPKKAKLIIVLCIGMVAFLLIFIIFNMPQISKLSSAKRQEQELKMQLVGLFPQSVAINQQQKQIQELEVKIQEQNGMLPKPEEMRGILDKLTKMTAENQLNLVLLKPQANRQEDYYVAIPIAMEIEGSYSQLTKFITQLSTSDYVINIQSAEIKLPEVEKDKQSNGALIMSLVVEVYYYSPRPEPVTAKKKGAARGTAH